MNQVCWWVLHSQVYCSTFHDTGDIWNSDRPEIMVETAECRWTGSYVSQLRWYAGPQGERTQWTVELSPVVLVTTDETPCDCCWVKPHCLQSFGRGQCWYLKGCLIKSSSLYQGQDSQWSMRAANCSCSNFSFKVSASTTLMCVRLSTGQTQDMLI